MGLLLSLYLLNDHTALQALVGPFTISLFMLYYVHALHIVPAVDAGYLDVGTYRLMLLNL